MPKRYTLADVTSNQFYQMPKFLFEGELKNSLSNDAKVLYSLLKDRHELSIKNNWVNKNNEVYLIMTRDEMSNLLGISIKPVLKAVNKLKDFGLLQEVRQGLNKPNLIYLLDYSQSQLLTCQNDISEVVTMTYPELSNRHTSNTNNINTDISNTDYQSIYQQEQQNSDEKDMIDSREEVIKIVKENIEYDLCKQAQGEKEYVDNIVAVMVDVICSTSHTVRVGGQDKPQSVVKSQFLKLTYEHIEYVCLCLSDNTSKIKNIRSYLITALYNAPQTMNTYYTQRVRHDFA